MLQFFRTSWRWTLPPRSMIKEYLVSFELCYGRRQQANEVGSHFWSLFSLSTWAVGAETFVKTILDALVLPFCQCPRCNHVWNKNCNNVLEKNLRVLWFLCLFPWKFSLCWLLRFGLIWFHWFLFTKLAPPFTTMNKLACLFHYGSRPESTSVHNQHTTTFNICIYDMPSPDRLSIIKCDHVTWENKSIFNNLHCYCTRSTWANKRTLWHAQLSFPYLSRHAILAPIRFTRGSLYGQKLRRLQAVLRLFHSALS